MNAQSPRYEWQIEPISSFIHDLIHRVNDVAEIFALLKRLNKEGPLNPVRAEVNDWKIRIFPPMPITWSLVYASKSGKMTALYVFVDRNPDDRQRAIEQALPVAEEWCR